MNMPKDQLLEELAQVIREESPSGGNQLDERWEDLCTDQLDASERKALKTEAQCSDLGQTAWRAFQPPSSELRQRLVQGILAEGARLDEQKPLARKRFRIPWSWRQTLPWTVAAVLTVGVLGALAFRGTSPAEDRALSSFYTLKIDGIKTQRSTDKTEVVRWLPGEHYGIRFAPEQGLRESVEIHIYVFDRETLERWTEAENNGRKYANGTFELTGYLNLDLRPGPWELVTVVGLPGTLPEDSEIRRSLENPSAANTNTWQLCRKAFSFEAADP